MIIFGAVESQVIKNMSLTLAETDGQSDLKALFCGALGSYHKDRSIHMEGELGEIKWQPTY